MLFNSITFIFSILILSLFILVFLSFFIKNNIIAYIGGKLSSSSSMLLTSIGILGTFVGIVYALLDFDTRDLDNSIPQLLEGMKVAFFTSVIGMGASIILKIVIALFSDDETDENTFFIENIKRQTNSLENVIPDLINQLIIINNVQQAQLKSLENNIISQFSDFAADVSEKSSQYIVEALDNIVDNFNESINNQLGDSFIKFEKSIQELLIWQENYKNFLIKIGNGYELNLGILNEVKESILDIEHSLSNLPILMKDFEKAILFNEKQIGKIGSEIGIFIDIKEKALNSFSQIEHHFVRMADEVEKSIGLFNKSLQKNTVETKEKLARLSGDTIDAFNIHTKKIQDYNDSSFNNLLLANERVSHLISSLDNILLSKFENYQKEFARSIESITSTQVLEIEKAMQEQFKEYKTFIESRSSKGFFSKFRGGK